MDAENNPAHQVDIMDANIEHYLELPLRLFAAASGIYDPIMNNYSEDSSLATSNLDHEFEEAKAAVHQSTWQSSGISNSMDYLRKVLKTMASVCHQMFQPPRVAFRDPKRKSMV